MNCPIRAHPLKDGVIVEEKHIIRFIQKAVIDFRPEEQVCRRCYKLAVDTYADKMKRAKELKLSLHANSLSTLSSSTKLSQQHSHSSNDSYDNVISKTPYHEKVGRSAGQLPQEITAGETSPVSSISIASKTSAITVRKKTITDFFTPKDSETQNRTNGRALNNVSQNNQRRDSQMPTTSAAAATARVSMTNDRNLQNSQMATTAISDSASRLIEDDDTPLMSLNYFNGTRLPDVQPFPPRRKPRLNNQASEIMNSYIQDITGG